ncbi:hypothetical protein F5Y11DRAFT_48977 [Daldinia sp. FL1419]|nr:hypothetical protein F5Y11DRAFT_48977 [Daldinia sp. FL1419]
MNSRICSQCRKALHKSLRTPTTLQRKIQQRPLSSTTARQNSSSSSSPSSSPLATLLSKPTWSVRSLLPDSSSTPSEEISPRTLHHLLRLSALPPPTSPAEESQMLSTLSSQLHFVRSVRSVDTTGVEPLRAIRDETTLGQREQTIGLEELKDALADEDFVGHTRRPRRRQRNRGADPGVEGWDVLAGASETAGRYFVVRTGSTTGPVRTGSRQEENTNGTQL